MAHLKILWYYRSTEVIREWLNVQVSITYTMTNVTLRRIHGTTKKVWAEIQQILIRYELYDSAKEAFQYLNDHPVLLAIIIGMALTCTIPVLIFIIFVLISLVVTFTGFLIVEG